MCAEVIMCTIVVIAPKDWLVDRQLNEKVGIYMNNRIKI